MNSDTKKYTKFPSDTIICRKEAHITIKESSGNLYGGCNIIFEMRDQIVDQTFRYNELENRQVDLRVPPVWKNDMDVKNKAFQPDFVVSYKKAYLENKDDREAVIKMSTRPSPMTNNFNL